MKYSIYNSIGLFLLLACLSASAASPSQIVFAGKKKTFLSRTPYKVYDVHCTDGKRGHISHWDQKKPWCSGTDTSECFATQIKAATEVCK